MPVMKKVIITSKGNLSDENVVAETPKGMPDVILVPLSVLQRLAIKFAKVYVSSLIAFLGAATLGVVSVENPVALNDFLQTLLQAAQLALVPAIGTVIVNIGIFVTKLDDSLPSLMA